tara:strand:- start:1419 stop:2084 length:666 start_codon:yes stop_codon:yes gene_type:complete
MKIIIASSKPWFVPSDYLKENNQILFIKNKSDLNIENIKEFNPSLIFFPHWSWKVSKEIYDKYKCILFHTAPLPFGRGGSPIQNLILLGYSKSPVCALKMVEGLDCGPIYSKKDLILEGSLSKILKRLNQVVNDLIEDLIRSLPEPVMQDGEVYNFTRLSEEDNQISERGSLQDFFDRVRMLDDSSYPNSFIKYGDYIIEFNKVKFADGKIICEAQINIDK